MSHRRQVGNKSTFILKASTLNHNDECKPVSPVPCSQAQACLFHFRQHRRRELLGRDGLRLALVADLKLSHLSISFSLSLSLSLTISLSLCLSLLLYLILGRMSDQTFGVRERHGRSGAVT